MRGAPKSADETVVYMCNDCMIQRTARARSGLLICEMNQDDAFASCAVAYHPSIRVLDVEISDIHGLK